MNLLLDTHTFIWFLSGNENISPKAKFLIQDSSTLSFVSIVSIWEISIKYRETEKVREQLCKEN